VSFPPTEDFGNWFQILMCICTDVPRWTAGSKQLPTALLGSISGLVDCPYRLPLHLAIHTHR